MGSVGHPAARPGDVVHVLGQIVDGRWHCARCGIFLGDVPTGIMSEEWPERVGEEILRTADDADGWALPHPNAFEMTLRCKPR